MNVRIAPLANDEEAAACAAMMAATSPWSTLGRTFDDCLTIVRNPDREVYVARGDAAEDSRATPEVVGFIILSMRGAFPGYIQILCVSDAVRGHGVGTELMKFAEERIFRETPNAFICVSDFNDGARRLYERLGYKLVGELNDYLQPGISELLLRKTIAPIDEFRKRARG